MKVLFLTEYFPTGRDPIFTGGVESRVWHLAEYLKKQGHQGEVKYRTKSYQFNNPLTVISRVWFIMLSILQLVSTPERYDIVEGTNFTTHLLAYLWAKRTGARAVAWYPDVFAGRGIKLLGLISGLTVELAEKISLLLPWDGVIALSHETEKKLKVNRIRARKLSVIYGGVSIPSISSNPSHPSFRSSHLTILCIARLVSYKRIDDFLLAIYLVKQRIKDIRAVIVGDGTQRNFLHKLAIQLGISDVIIWINRISEADKWQLLRESYIHVLPSVVEGFGLVTIESLIVGTPVVNADTPVNREILQGSLGALLFPPGDYVALAESIEMLINDNRLYLQKVKAGKFLAKDYSWDKVNSETEKFYQSLL